MEIDISKLRDSIPNAIDSIPFIDCQSIPNIELYMDQVTTFMDKYLRGTTRFPEYDKILTKTMINNYAKNDLLPAPDKKKYSKDHLLLLLFIYYFKNVLSMNDIQVLLGPLTDKYFNGNRSTTIEKLYTEILEAEKKQVESIKEDVDQKLAAAKEVAASLDDKDDYLELFTFISLLNHDICVKKQIMEKILDDYAQKHKEKATSSKPKSKNKTVKKRR